MKNVMVLFIGGEMFLFENCGYSSEQIRQLETYARNALTEYPNLEVLDNNAVCKWYIQAIKNQFDIKLNKINISFIVRINK